MSAYWEEDGTCKTRTLDRGEGRGWAVGPTALGLGSGVVNSRYSSRRWVVVAAIRLSRYDLDLVPGFHRHVRDPVHSRCAARRSHPRSRCQNCPGTHRRSCCPATGGYRHNPRYVESCPNVLRGPMSRDCPAMPVAVPTKGEPSGLGGMQATDPGIEERKFEPEDPPPIGDVEEILRVGSHGGVAFDGGVELVLELHGPSMFVVMEEIVNNLPERSCRGGGGDDKIRDFVGDGRENPALEKSIQLEPFIVVFRGGDDRAIEVPMEIEAPN
ncbi:unnamed protein product [Cuscuta campestris]|uniref:Uncharacterized protein n=1 Tax=Cuscuta campestris TaxID=132261 RepID=A0A484KYX2_9ASTE|nr:unnamed protein product [Cuscuta campestris]